MRVGALNLTHNGLTMCDPNDRDYDGGSTTKAKFYWNKGKQPIINSQAHGGIVYTIEAEKEQYTKKQKTKREKRRMETHPYSPKGT